MSETDKCCCGCTYQVASKSIAVFGIISSIAGMGIITTWKNQYVKLLQDGGLGEDAPIEQTIQTIYVVGIVVLAIAILMNCVLLNGALQRNKGAVVCWMIFQGMYLAGSLYGVLRNPLVLVEMVFRLYLLYVVNCFYSELKEEAVAKTSDRVLLTSAENI